MPDVQLRHRESDVTAEELKALKEALPEMIVGIFGVSEERVEVTRSVVEEDAIVHHDLAVKVYTNLSTDKAQLEAWERALREQIKGSGLAPRNLKVLVQVRGGVGAHGQFTS